MLTFTTLDAFRAAFPSSRRYIKANAPESPCVGIQVARGLAADISKAGWVAPWADITNPINSDTKLVLVNTPIGECYACEIGFNSRPVGYVPRPIEAQNLGPVTAYKTRDEKSPLLTFPVLSGSVKVNGVEVGPGQVIFARLQDGTVGVVDASKLVGMEVDDSGLFDGSAAIAYDSEAIYASEPLTEEFEYDGLEGRKRAPVGSRLAYSDTKNLYFIKPESWAKMGYGLDE